MLLKYILCFGLHLNLVMKVINKHISLFSNNAERADFTNGLGFNQEANTNKRFVKEKRKDEFRKFVI